MGMRVRSTGLGTTELHCDLDSAYTKEGYLVMDVKSTEPVVWHIRVAVTYKEVWSSIWRLVLKGAVKYMLFGWAFKRGALNEY